MSTARLKILENSLVKKQAKFDDDLAAHFSDVRSANGQPLNDKRNGQATLDRWSRQDVRLRKLDDEIKKTENAIEFEKGKIAEVNNSLSKMPAPIVKLVTEGVLNQWRKHPTTFFVDGVEKARVQYKGGKLYHRYLTSIPNQEQREKFKAVVNELVKQLAELEAA